MPVYVLDKPVMSIKRGDADIREVRRGDDLVWGLYLITYTDGVDSSTGGLTKYVWGYPNYPATPPGDFTLTVPGDKTAAQNTYKTHCDGWYEGYELLNYIPAVTMDFHRDLSLYCNWRQRRYKWEGRFKYEHYEGGGSGFDPRYSTPTDTSTWYGSYNSWNRFSSYGNEGNCTWYAYGRTGEIANRNIYDEFYITSGSGHGKDWIYNTWPDETHTSGSIDLELGDILVWGCGTYGHVEVVENIESNSITTSYSISGVNWSDSMYFNTRSIAIPNWNSYLGWVEYNDGSRHYLSNCFIGYIHNPYADQGGSGSWSTVSISFESQGFVLCGPSDSYGQNSGTQDLPKTPQVYDPASHSDRRNPRWAEFLSRTEERRYSYSKMGWDNWTVVNDKDEIDLPTGIQASGWSLNW